MVGRSNILLFCCSDVTESAPGSDNDLWCGCDGDFSSDLKSPIPHSRQCLAESSLSRPHQLHNFIWHLVPVAVRWRVEATCGRFLRQLLIRALFLPTLNAA